MSPVLPRLALHALRGTGHPMLVASRRGQVLHLVDAGCCHPACSITPTGRIRRHLRPLCGQSGRAWHFQDSPARPLCAYCTAIAGRVEQPADWRRLDVLDVLRATAMATTAADVAAATRAICEAGLAGDSALRRTVRDRRTQLLPPRVSTRDVAWATALPLDGTKPHPHPPVRHNFAA